MSSWVYSSSSNGFRNDWLVQEGIGKPDIAMDVGNWWWHQDSSSAYILVARAQVIISESARQ
jgi:hypothetical protein